MASSSGHKTFRRQLAPITESRSPSQRWLASRIVERLFIIGATMEESDRDEERRITDIR